MIPLGLNARERRQLDQLLVSSHHIRINVMLLSLNHEYLQNLSDQLIDGNVMVDRQGEVTRTLDMTLLDPNHNMRLTSDDPDDGAIFLDRMIKVVYTVMSPDRKLEFDIPVFCGPITKVERDPITISLEAQGKEVIGLATAWNPRTYKKGMTKIRVIRDLLVVVMGENRLSLPALGAKITRNYSLGVEDAPWLLARRVARTMNRQLFYDGRGRARLRRVSTRSVYTFKDGRGGSLISSPNISYMTKDIANAVLVIGAKPKGSNKKIRVREVAGRAHPLSPHRLGRTARNGVHRPRFIPKVITDDSISTKKAAKDMAKKVLKNNLINHTEASFDSLPIPYLEPGDVCRIKTSEYGAAFRINQFNIPLVADGIMGVGYIKKTTPRRRVIRRKRRQRR